MIGYSKKIVHTRKNCPSQCCVVTNFSYGAYALMRHIYSNRALQDTVKLTLCCMSNTAN